MAWDKEKDTHWVQMTCKDAMQHYMYPDNSQRDIKCVLEDTTIELPQSSIENVRLRQISVQMIVMGKWFLRVGNNE